MQLVELADGQGHRSVVFEGLTLGERTLRNAEFDDVLFKDCRFEKVKLMGVQLSSCRFSGCDLTRLGLAGSTFNDVRFEDCRMMGIDFAALLQVIIDMGFRDCVLDYGGFSRMKLRDTPFLDCRIRDADFSHTTLPRAVFSGSDLSGSTFNHADLIGADFRNATGVSFDPKLVKLGGTRVDLETLLAIGDRIGLNTEIG